MVKIPLNRVEENIEICCSERIKNSVKNFQLSLLVHLVIPFQRSVISISISMGISENLEVLPIGQHLKILIFNLFPELEKIGKSSLE